MPVLIHHQPVDPTRTWSIHAWNNVQTWDLPGQPGAGGTVEFSLPDMPDTRQLQFMFHAPDPATAAVVWEPDTFIRLVRLAQVTELWSFDFSARLLYVPPVPAGRRPQLNDALSFHVITQTRFAGGSVYAWNPYLTPSPSELFPQTDRNAPVSTFAVPVRAWMIDGFHFKLVAADGTTFEPDASNRVWRPSDGTTPWIKSGQVSIRSQPFTLTSAPVEVLFPASLVPPPSLDLIDPVEDVHQTLTASAVVPAQGSALFQVAQYTGQMYPDAVYTLAALGSSEGAQPISRPFPTDPDNPATPSRMVLGIDGWRTTLAVTLQTTTIIAEGVPGGTFGPGLTLQAGIGAAPPFETVPVTQNADGTWTAQPTVCAGLPQWITYQPPGAPEPIPEPGLEPRRFFTPAATPETWFTAEGVHGLTKRGHVVFGEPPDRGALLAAAFGQPCVSAGVFGPAELPHGATLAGTEVWFVLHAPHAAWAGLVLVSTAAGGTLARQTVPLALTRDGLYWWCSVPAASAPPGTRYRFALNDDLEILDPAAREVLDRGDFESLPGEDPNDVTTSWSLVADVAAARAIVQSQPWNTMGWERLLSYELHPSRFTDLAQGALMPLDLVADELQPVCRRNVPGYLWTLPVTALQLMPVHEFKSTNSWGYNAAFFFAVDGGYGGSLALARLVRAAHAAGRGVLLDLVYNHLSDSPLLQVAPEIYSNGDTPWGPRIRNDHPMVLEFLRQATVHFALTFGLDGFRLDSTTTIVQNDGWSFLGALRSAVRLAASSAGRDWPYVVGENDPKFWDITNPAWSIVDGQWDISESYALAAVAADPGNPSADDASQVQGAMTVPGRSFSEATRFAESHDKVSGQGAGQLRIAAQPPQGLGLQTAKSIGTLVLLSNGVPMLFMGQEVGETACFSFDTAGVAVNPQLHDLSPEAATDNTRVLQWFRQLLGLRNDPSKGLQGDANVQVVAVGRRTVAFTCGSSQNLFVVITCGTPDQQQSSAWLGLPGGTFKEIFNSSAPGFQVELEQEQTNGGAGARITSGDVLSLPHAGAVVLERW